MKGLKIAPSLPLPSTTPIYFSDINVTPHVFHLTPYTIAIAPVKPIIKGHVLICPLRPRKRLSSLSAVESADFFLVVDRVSRMLEKHYNATGLNLVLQDGHDAGQRVPHVHMHVNPRTNGDLEGRGGVDAVYDLWEGEEGDLKYWDGGRKKDRGAGVRVDEEGLVERRKVEMKEEAEMFRRRWRG